MDESQMNENQLGESEVDALLLEKIQGHSELVNVNEEEFLDLLKNSLSLTVLEKKKVIDAVPTLSQFQFDQLCEVFFEERTKFRELAKDHPEDIKKLLVRQQEDWIVLGNIYYNQQKQEAVANEDQQKIDDLKKSLGL